MRSAAQKDDSFFFDDCPICQAQKRADDAGRLITLEELEASFAAAAKLPGVVSGSMDELPGRARPT